MGVSITRWFVLSVVVLCVAYDVFAVNRWGVAASISEVLLNLSCTDPIVAFAAGLVCGHIFWNH